jgi:hypothetical protein
MQLSIPYVHEQIVGDVLFDELHIGFATEYEWLLLFELDGNLG